jgi:hypothetical protein
MSNNAFIYPRDDELVEVTIRGRVTRSDANGFEVRGGVANTSSYVHPAHITMVVRIPDTLIPGAIYRDDAGVVWQATSDCKTNTSTPLRRFGDVGQYSRSCATGALTLIWQASAPR